MTARVPRQWAVDQLAAVLLWELATSVVPEQDGDQPERAGDEVTAAADLSELPWHLRQEVVDRAAVLADALTGPPRSAATALAALAGETPPTTEEETWSTPDSRATR